MRRRKWCFLCRLYPWLTFHCSPVVSLEIIGVDMPSVVEGGTFQAMVVAKNAGGRVVALPAGVTVADQESPALGSPGAVDASTGLFTFTAGTVDGPGTLAASGGGLVSDPYAFSVTADNTPRSLTVVDA